VRRIRLIHGSVRDPGEGAELLRSAGFDVDAGPIRGGPVHYKICSVDATWSGLLFRQR
jgi:hypothetical protein